MAGIKMMELEENQNVGIGGELNRWSQCKKINFRNYIADR